MSQTTADIVGNRGANFTLTINSGTILSAYLEVVNQPVIALAIGASERQVTISNLPVGESWVRLDIVWAPVDPNATIDVGTVTSGSASAATPKHTLDSGNTPGYVELFGT